MTSLPRITCPTCGRRVTVGRTDQRIRTHGPAGRPCAASCTRVDLYGTDTTAVTR